MCCVKSDKVTINELNVKTLWDALVNAQANCGAISIETQHISQAELKQAMQSLGHHPTEAELTHLMQEVDLDASGTIEYEEFQTLLLSRHGERASRLKLAFNVFDEDGNGQISADELSHIMSRFEMTDAELNEMIQEVDYDGDRQINFEEFCKLVADELSHETGYRDTPNFSNSLPNSTKVEEIPRSSEFPSQANVSLQINPDFQTSTKETGTSRLQMQSGLFRLIQGAAYRCFRECFSANHETHLRVKNLPYRITDFVAFLTSAIELYKKLGIVETACHPVLDALVTSITEEYTRLETRVRQWHSINKTPEMLATEQIMLAARGKSTTVQEKFRSGVEFAITLKKKRLCLADVAGGVLAIHELDRLRKIEAQECTPIAPLDAPPKSYLSHWNRVILADASEAIDGAMMPVAYWYEDFMPKLLAAFSVTTAADIEPNIHPNETELNQWYEHAQASGEFDPFGADVAEGFLNCTPSQKLRVKQAWRLTRSYLNGVQKRRERLEAGRESGTLSQYVAFIDVYLGQRDVQTAQMRLSFPYYLGPAVWRFFHTTAEIVCTRPSEEQVAIVNQIKEFFQLFAALYPCPYCRHHLNVYVVRNREVEMYPLEYLMLGHDLQQVDFVVSLDAKLSSLVDGESLRLFFWKLHNAVSASISRSEEWYHYDENAFYTSRYFPSLEAELAQAQALGTQDVNCDRIAQLYALVKPTSRLMNLRTALKNQVGREGCTDLKNMCSAIQRHTQNLEEAVLKGRFLQDLYCFDPEKVERSLQVTPQYEALARSNVFTETTLSIT
jgi:Ca2+-binding EF-hand superfamily protein